MRPRLQGRTVRGDARQAWWATVAVPASAALLLRHEGIPVAGGRHERLLDAPHAGPPQQVHLRPRLVVGARGAAAAERLLTDHRAGRLVVDVEVAGGVAQDTGRLHDGRPVAGED